MPSRRGFRSFRMNGYYTACELKLLKNLHHLPFISCRKKDDQGRRKNATHPPPTPSLPPTSFPFPPPPPSPLPVPADAADVRRRRRKRREPATGGPEPAPLLARPPGAGGLGGGKIKSQWLTPLMSRTCRRKYYQAARRNEPEQPGTGSKFQQDKWQDIKGYKGL